MTSTTDSTVADLIRRTRTDRGLAASPEQESL